MEVQFSSVKYSIKTFQKMNDDIYTILSSALFSKEIPQESKSKKLFNTISAIELNTGGFPNSTTVPEPSVLLNAFPIILDPNEYANPLSTANPNGNLIPLWRFRQLVDPIPQFSSVYTPSGNSFEMFYTQIIQGATANDNDSFASLIIAKANKEIVTETFANMDGSPGNWRPVYAVPDDWYDLKKMSTKKQLNLDLSKMSAYTDSREMGNSLKWKISKANNSTSEIALDKNSKINSAQIDYQMVTIIRPWFNSMIFETNGWYLKKQSAGYCSSGLNDGKGVIPVIPTSIIIGTGVKINSDWSEQDKNIIKNAQDCNQQLSLGPLLVNTQQNEEQLYVLGWVISRIPFSPQINNI